MAARAGGSGPRRPTSRAIQPCGKTGENTTHPHPCELYRRHFSQPEILPLPARLTDDEILKRALRAKNRDNFRRLFVDGDFTGYASRSEADLALINMLVFWVGADPARIERLFERSGLFKEATLAISTVPAMDDWARDHASEAAIPLVVQSTFPA